MSEMLANQYFMARNFISAESEYEKYVISKPDSLLAKKKLIICYTENGKIDKALKLFNDVISIQIQIITSTDLIKDDCPCPEIIKRIIEINDGAESADVLIQLGILWLYCNPETSLSYFEKAKLSGEYEYDITFAIDKIKAFLTKIRGIT
ncbi:MAG: tol-pal system YbgF family protein [Rhodothermaceae bacterium]